MRATTTIDRETLAVLSGAQIEGTCLRLTCGTLERKQYEATNKVLSAMGGRWDRRAGGHIFRDCPKEDLDAVLATGTVTNRKALLQQFFTPPELARELVVRADIHPGMRVLEPSAGEGSIARAVRSLRPECELHTCEIDPRLTQALESAGFLVIWSDFLTYAPGAVYDRIVANPPFAGRADLAHVLHMIDTLKPGGWLVSVLCGSVLWRQDDRTRAFLDALDDASAGDYRIEELPTGSFAESGTDVSTAMLVLNKAA